jgi:hypothetical protein
VLREARSKQDRSVFPSQDYFQAGIFAGRAGVAKIFHLDQTRKTRRFDAVWRFRAAFECLPMAPCRNV